MTSNPKNALILGITGQDGSLLADLLLKKGYIVHGTTRSLSEANLSRLNYLNLKNYMKLHELDLSDFDNVNKLLNEVKYEEIYMLSGQSSVSFSYINPIETFESIVTATIILCSVIKELDNKPKTFFASSSEIYGSSEEPISLNSIPSPKNPYAIAKNSANEIIRYYRDNYNLNFVIGHMFNHESELRGNQYVTRKVALFLCSKNIKNRKKLRLGNLDVVRDWGSAKEFVYAIWLSLQVKDSNEHIICTGKGTSLQDLVSLMFKSMNLNWRDFIEIDNKLIRPNDPNKIVGNPKKAYIDLGWKHSSDIESFIDELLKNTVKSINQKW